MAAVFTDSSSGQAMAQDRLGFAFCVALAVHAAVILGISFDRQDRSLAQSKLEITLAQHRSKSAPKEADFLAQSNQQGSGTLQQAAMLTTRQQADFHDTAINEISQQRAQAAPRPPALRPIASLATRAQSALKTSLQQPIIAIEQLERQLAGNKTAYQRTLEIASLEAKLDMQRHAYAKRPRIRRLTSMATKEAEDALYLHNWRSKIEAIGNQHYPAKARAQQLYGELRLVVSLLPNGEVLSVKILKSSGHSLLDQAAVRIVHLASPYQQFPAKMRNTVDVLEIIRTWRFHNNSLSANS
ncbi:MAG: protein TonB [Paraglaciecola psychrophila]|jgi:protein TonB